MEVPATTKKGFFDVTDTYAQETNNPEIDSVLLTVRRSQVLPRHRNKKTTVSEHNPRIHALLTKSEIIRTTPIYIPLDYPKRVRNRPSIIE